jgi:DNA-binding CsgD family transcriptional regulator
VGEHLGELDSASRAPSASSMEDRGDERKVASGGTQGPTHLDFGSHTRGGTGGVGARRSHDSLSNREVQVLAHVAAGLADRQIARRFDWSVGQVRYSIRVSMKKLSALNRPHAVALAIRWGYLSVPT